MTRLYGNAPPDGKNQRQLGVERRAGGIVLTVTTYRPAPPDRAGRVRDRVLGRAVVDPGALLDSLIDPTPGATTLGGESPLHGSPVAVRVEVRGNEVLVHIRPEDGPAAEAAVGLDDLQDALEQAIGRV